MRLVPSGEYAGHQLPGGKMFLAPHQKWIGTCGKDGHVTVRPVGDLARVVDLTAHDYSTGGVHTIAYSSDYSRLLTCGYDGALCSYLWQ